MMVFCLLVCASFLGLVSSSPYLNCSKDVSGVVNSFELKGCPDTDSNVRQKCFIRKGDVAEAVLKFTPGSDIDQPIMEGTGGVMGIKRQIPYKMGYHREPCSVAHDSSNITCPLHKGVPNSYSIRLPLERDKVLTGECFVRWALKDQNGQDIVCILVDVRVLE